ncbi:hypothetical protein EYF80_067485 [Liparis tanakae]|uniref:Uncharacterized protein n=1 Tax=Liparis tanakae TaxID=230148 RepID=A0A4Z2E0T6_9TELE|nr:hypothetical protein EYF80_067485 [Liparis tanakae]
MKVIYAHHHIPLDSWLPSRCVTASLRQAALFRSRSSSCGHVCVRVVWRDRRVHRDLEVTDSLFLCINTHFLNEDPVELEGSSDWSSGRLMKMDDPHRRETKRSPAPPPPPPAPLPPDVPVLTGSCVFRR